MAEISTDDLAEAVRSLSLERPIVIAEDVALEFDIDKATALALLTAAVREDKVEILHVVTEWDYDDGDAIEYDVYRTIGD
jgi:hypothetical protein